MLHCDKCGKDIFGKWHPAGGPLLCRKCRKTPHPALVLFEQMFREAADDPTTIVPPEYFVERGVFVERARREGIEIDDNLIRMADWEEAIGIRALAHKLVREHHRKHGTKPDPLLANFARFERRLKRQGIH